MKRCLWAPILVAVLLTFLRAPSTLAADPGSAPAPAASSQTQANPQPDQVSAGPGLPDPRELVA